MKSSVDFYRISKSNLPVSYIVTSGSRVKRLVQSDITLCAYNMSLRMLAEFQEEIYSDPNSPSGLNKVRLFEFHEVVPLIESA
jgi:hypothetical protein